MTADEYLDKILERMTATHDIERGFGADGRTFDAYAQYNSFAEKYVLTRKANLWKVSESEHVLFLTVPAGADPEVFYEDAGSLIDGYMEPVLARAQEKYPPKDHMRTFLTVVLLMEQTPEEELVKKIRRYRYDRSYLFSLRGYSQGRLIAVDLSGKKVYTSPAAKDVAGFYRQVL